MSGDSRLQGNSKTRLGDLKDNLGTAYFLKTARLREIRMQDLTEKTIRKVGTVRITNLRVIFGTKSYELSNITSASLQVEEPKLFLPIFFAITMGICSVLVAISN